MVKTFKSFGASEPNGQKRIAKSAMAEEREA
jgi:hypothetical protein